MSDYIRKYVFDDQNRLSDSEVQELKSVVADLGRRDYPWDGPNLLLPFGLVSSDNRPNISSTLEWLVYCANIEVFCQSRRYLAFVEERITPRQSLLAARDFTKALNRALSCWRDMGKSARTRAGLVLNESAAELLDPHRVRPERTPETDARMAFQSPTDEYSADLLHAILKHLEKSVNEAADSGELEYERVTSAKRSHRELAAENIIRTMQQLEIPRTDPRGVYRRVVNVTLCALDRKMDWAPPTGEWITRGGRIGTAPALDAILKSVWAAID